MAEAFRFYRDELKLHVYPVDGPWSKKADPGKKPSVKAWWNYDPKECDVEQFFRPQRCHNIGVCPTGNFISSTSTARRTRGRAFTSSSPASRHSPKSPGIGPAADAISFSFARTSHQSGGRGATSHTTRLSFPNSRTRSAPSCTTATIRTLSFRRRPHRRHVQIRMGGHGRDPDGFMEMVRRDLRVQASGGERGKPKKGLRFHFTSISKGTSSSSIWSSLPRALDLRPNSSTPRTGKYAITCPWAWSIPRPRKPTSPRRSSTRKRSGIRWPGFKCLHSHCEARGLQLIEWAESREKGIVDSALLPVARLATRANRPRRQAADPPSPIQRARLGLPYRPGQDHGRAAGLVRLARQGLPSRQHRERKNLRRREEEADLVHSRQRLRGSRNSSGVEGQRTLRVFLHSRISEKGRSGESLLHPQEFLDGVLHAALEDPHLLAELPNPHRILTVPFPLSTPRARN